MNSARHRVCIVPLNPLFIRLFWVSKTYRMFAIRYTGGEGETRTHTPFPATACLANKFLTIRITSPYGCGGWTRTNGRTGRLLRESKSRALPTWRHRNIVERIKGFEPSQPAWKAGMLTVKHHILIFCNRAKGLTPLGAATTRRPANLVVGFTFPIHLTTATTFSYLILLALNPLESNL